MNTEKLYDLFLSYPTICTDTRKVVAQSLFFALKGPNFNGNTFAQKALDSGAAFVITDEETDSDASRTIRVPDVLSALQQLAQWHRRKLKIPVIAIAGSNGKTTSKELIYAVLSTHFSVLATPGNWNNHLGVPLTLLQLTSKHTFAVIEIGANHPKENQFLCELAEPDFALVTNCGKDHLEGFGSLEGVIRANSEVYDYLAKTGGTAFVHADDSILTNASQAVAKRLFYAAGNHPEAQLNIPASQLFPEIHFTLKNECKSVLSGDYNFANILAAICIGLHMQVPIEKIEQGIQQYAPSNMRSQRINTGKNKVFLDAYNANPSSMEVALRNIASEDKHAICILGDMFELGDYSAKEHQAIVDLCQSLQLTHVILCGEAFSATQHKPYISLANTATLKQYIQEHPIENAFVFLKGSRGMKLEELLTLL